MSETLETTNQAQATPEASQSTAQKILQAKAQPGVAEGIETDSKVQGKPEDTDFSRKFAALSKRQKELFFKEQELKKQEEKYRQLEELEALREKNPLEYLEKKNLKFDDLLTKVLKDGEPPSVDDKIAQLEAKIANYEKEQIEKAKLAEESEKKKAVEAEQKAIDSFKKEIDNFIKSDMDKFELIHANEATEMVFDVISENFLKTNQVIPISEAAQMVEEYLEKEMLEKFLKLKKVQQRLAPKAEEKKALSPVEEMLQAAPSYQQTLKATLTPSASETASPDRMSSDERYKKALEIMRQGGFR